MNAQEWASYLADAQNRVSALRTRLDAGQDEASAMTAEGFSGRNGIAARVAEVRRNVGLEA